ncbi:MAG: DUF5688 family protein [Hungatella sp.]|nr:DUF5688 family protein [Hungatella sp.]
MEYNQFLLNIQMEVQKQLGDGFHVQIQRVIKNNDTLLDGLVIRKEQEHLAPTIYLNPYFEDLKREPDMEVQEIISRILCVYKQNADASFENGKVEELADFNNIRNKVAYKLIHRESNQELLKEIPYVEFLDLAIVFYLILDESRNGQMTALIHTHHMVSWGTTREELYLLAKKNTPELLPAKIRNMEESLEELLKADLGDFGDIGMVNQLLGAERIPIYVLSNKKMLNGACCILYENCLERFAAEQGADIIILPSSVHESLLILDRDKENSYEDFSSMVTEINQNEVSEEDRLSNQIYRYSRSSGTIEIVFQTDKCLINRKL